MLISKCETQRPWISEYKRVGNLSPEVADAEREGLREMEVREEKN